MDTRSSPAPRRTIALRLAAAAFVIATAVALGGSAIAASAADSHSGYAPGGGSARSAMLFR